MMVSSMLHNRGYVAPLKLQPTIPHSYLPKETKATSQEGHVVTQDLGGTDSSRLRGAVDCMVVLMTENILLCRLNLSAG